MLTVPVCVDLIGQFALSRQKKYDSVTNNYVDASNTGWACQLQLSTGQTQTAHGYWNHQEATMSISWRELEAAFHALQTFPHLKNMRILIRTDNITSMSYMSKQGGTQSLPLMELAPAYGNGASKGA